MVERQFCKLMGVSSTLTMGVLNKVTSLSLAVSLIIKFVQFGRFSSAVEHQFCKLMVVSSNLTIGLDNIIIRFVQFGQFSLMVERQFCKLMGVSSTLTMGVLNKVTSLSLAVSLIIKLISCYFIQFYKNFFINSQIFYSLLYKKQVVLIISYKMCKIIVIAYN